jgi:hypothetical protein
MNQLQTRLVEEISYFEYLCAFIHMLKGIFPPAVDPNFFVLERDFCCFHNPRYKTMLIESSQPEFLLEFSISLRIPA